MPTKSLIQLALPMVISFTFRFLFTLVDMIYAGAIKAQDPDAVAAIGLFLPIQTVFIALWVGLSAGFTASLSQAFGQHDEARVRALKGAMVKIHLLLVPLMLPLAALLWFVVPHLPDLEPGLKDSFRVYATVLLAGMPVAGFLSIYPDSIVKAHHDTISTMKAGLSSSVTNIVLNTVFVFVFHWGLLGIAIATVLSRYPSFFYARYRSRVLEGQRLAGLAAWDRGRQEWPGPLRSILTLAVPGGFTYLLLFLEEAVVMWFLKGLPHNTVAIAAFGVYNRLLSLVTMPAIATSVAVLPFVARLVPEGRTDEVVSDLRRGLVGAAGLCLCIALPAGWIFAEPIVAFLVPKLAETHGAASINVLFLLPFAGLAVVPFMVLRPVFEAVQRPRLGVMITMAKSLALSIPILAAGRHLAPVMELDPLLGILVGMAVAAMLASGMVVAASRHVLRGPLAASPGRPDSPGFGPGHIEET
ncbi:MAG: MATE family efflux transporter [Planctomycetota bacterium]|jgi:Na+-driven multidrug efflux pump